MRVFLVILFFGILLAAMYGYAYCQDVPPPELRELVALTAPEETALPLRPYALTPVIDPGHGGIDTGAVSPGGTAESGINLDISLKTDLLLRLLGVKTVLTRDSDLSIHDPSAQTIAEKKRSDLQNRVALAAATPNAVLISIHQNKFPEARYYGAQCFHNGTAESLLLAGRMQERLRLALDPENKREAKKTDGNVYLLKHSTVPTVLVECGFLSNPREEELLQNSGYQTKVALAICGGFFDYAADGKTG